MNETWELWARWHYQNGTIVEKQVAICATIEIALAEQTKKTRAFAMDDSIPDCERPGFFVKRGSILMGFQVVP